MSSDGVLIKYKRDYDPDDSEGKCTFKTFKMTIGPAQEEHKIRKSTGKSAEELMVETYDPVDVLLALFVQPATGPEKFRYLSLCLTGEAKASYDRLVASDYPTNADKTNANFIVLKRDILTSLSEYTHPGDRISTYLQTVVQYTYCKDEDGVQVKPGVYLARWRKMELLGSRMEHSLGPNYIPAETFKVAFFNSFPREMKKWMTDEHMKNPMSPANPMDCQEIADFFQHYWTLHYAGKKKQDKKRQSSDDNNNDEKDNQGSRKRQKRNNNNNHKSNGKNKSGSNKKCALFAHRDHNHDWDHCYNNPANVDNRYDFEASQRFCDNKATGQDSWYKDVHSKQVVNRRNRDGGGRGRGNGGRGGRYNNGGRGYGGRGRGGYNNYHNQGGNGANQGQGGDNGSGYHYQDGYHNQHYQQPPPQPPDDQASYHFVGHSRGTQFQAPNVPPQGPPSSAGRGYSGGRRF